MLFFQQAGQVSEAWGLSEWKGIRLGVATVEPWNYVDLCGGRSCFCPKRAAFKPMLRSALPRWRLPHATRWMSQVLRPPLPPFGLAEAEQKVRMAEDAWNSRDPEKVSLAYTEDCIWRNRDSFFQGREAIVRFLQKKWEKETEYRLIKELFAFEGHQIGVCFQYEFKDALDGSWYRAYGNENWDFAENGQMKRRQASINNVRIAEADRRFTWDLGARPLDFPGLKELEGKFGMLIWFIWFDSSSSFAHSWLLRTLEG